MTHDSTNDNGMLDLLHNMIDRAVIRAKMAREPIWLDPQTNMIRSNSYVFAGIDISTGSEPMLILNIGKEALPIRSIVRINIIPGTDSEPTNMVFGTEYHDYRNVAIHASNFVNPLPDVPTERTIPEPSDKISDIQNILHDYAVSHGIKEFDPIDISKIPFQDPKEALDIMWDNGMIYEKSLGIYGYIDMGAS